MAGGPRVAYYFHSLEQVPADEWCEEYTPTGMVYMVMVGDNRRHLLDPADVSILPELDYCHVCGQVGCTHDGLER